MEADAENSAVRKLVVEVDGEPSTYCVYQVDEREKVLWIIYISSPPGAEPNHLARLLVPLRRKARKEGLKIHMTVSMGGTRMMEFIVKRKCMPVTTVFEVPLGKNNGN